MGNRQCTLEAAQDGDPVLKGYDPINDRWSFSFNGPFWKAVEHAHSLGRRGAGHKVAIIDTGCDLSIPALRDRVEGQIVRIVPVPRPAEDTAHCTVVALLIAKVSPECRFNVYSVQGDSVINESDVVFAIKEAAESDATVINLSLGAGKSEKPEGPIPDPWKDPDNFKRDFCKEEPACSVCQAAAEAAKAGKLVFAAVGNSNIDIYCPARVQGVIAVGFQREERLIPSENNEITFGLPVRGEAPYADLFVHEVAGVLGSSFASPLYAGVGALGVTQQELAQYISSLGESVFPMLWHGNIDTMGGPPAADRDLVAEVENRYVNALKKLPHAHCSLHTQLRSDLPLTDPAGCAFCGFFAEPLYVKLGLWLYETGRHEAAINILEAARGIAPWSAEASAYLGLTFHAQGDVTEAIKNYEIALQLRPDYPLCASMLKTLRTPPGKRASIIAAADGPEPETVVALLDLANACFLRRQDLSTAFESEKMRLVQIKAPWLANNMCALASGGTRPDDKVPPAYEELVNSAWKIRR